MESLRTGQAAILAELRALGDILGHPAPAGLLADRLKIPARTARYHLLRLELAGLVNRPQGPRKGWMAVDTDQIRADVPIRGPKRGTRALVMTALIDIQRRLHRPAPTGAIEVRVPVGRRMVLYHLKQMEARKVVSRPRGPRHGWLYRAQPFDDVLLATLRQVQRDVHGPVRTVMLAALMGMSERTMTYYLRRLEMAGLVNRPQGPKSGWYCNDRNWPGWAALEAA